MNRRKFLKISAAGAALIGGATLYSQLGASDPLRPFYKATRKVLEGRFGDDLATHLVRETKDAYNALLPQIPYIGGEANMFAEWLNYGAYYLALFQALSNQGQDVDAVGRIIYETYELMADYPEWFLRVVARFKYGQSYQDKLRRAAGVSQKKEFPGDFVSIFIEGDGRHFDYGLDITECGICKLYHAHGSGKLARYMCLSDYVISQAFNRGLVRYQTIAEGAEKCDFRYKIGRATYVHPLRNGWPPRFGNGV